MGDTVVEQVRESFVRLAAIVLVRMVLCPVLWLHRGTDPAPVAFLLTLSKEKKSEIIFFCKRKSTSPSTPTVT